LLFGGAQSAKTFFAIYYIILRAIKYPKSIHAICRAKGVEVQAAILITLFPEIISILFPDQDTQGLITYHKSAPLFVKFYNGSMIFFLGLDDNNLGDKNLGRKFSTILIDEISEVHYSIYSKLMTRLSQQNEAKKVMLLTMNPTTKKHWAYKLFISKVEPRSNAPLANADSFASLQLNPNDNVDNLSEEYLETLKTLSPEDKERFLYGRFSDQVDGAVYNKELQEARNENRISENIEVSKLDYIYAVFDLGTDDRMAVWIVQFLKDKVLFLDYLHFTSTHAVDSVGQIFQRGWKPAGIYLPWDAKHRYVGNGMTVLEILNNLSSSDIIPDKAKFWTKVIPKLSLWQGIHASRLYFKRCYFALPSCKDGIESLENYRNKLDDSLEVVGKEPVHDWASHGADAFRYAITAYQYTHPIVVEKPKDPNKIYVSDLINDL
jgi:PBSX family phage terminase large subunit